MRIIKQKKKAFTLIETVVTILIYSFLLLMITNIVLMNSRLSQQLKMRSRIRAELSEIVTLVKRDIRNVTTIDTETDQNNCKKVETSGASTQKCTLNILGTSVVWKYEVDAKGNGKITREKKNGDEVDIYTSSDILKVNSMYFDIITDKDTLSKRATIIVTIKAEGRNPIWNVKNQIYQETISTRNYNLVL
jgi:type II secretory pathway component PulJ